MSRTARRTNDALSRFFTALIFCTILVGVLIAVVLMIAGGKR